MIDLHSHILPKVDDGSSSLSVSLDMARMAVADGTTHMACTPHIKPGRFSNSKLSIIAQVKLLREALDEHNIKLELMAGADVHIAPDLVKQLNKNEIPTLNGTKYFLFEPFQRIVPPMILELCEALLVAGYRPILTHPERLNWIDERYDLICRLHDMGMPIQLTATSFTGNYGRKAKYWSDKMISENRVDLIASDARNATTRPPGLSQAFEVLIQKVGEKKAKIIMIKNPTKILANQNLSRNRRYYFKKITNSAKPRGLFSFLSN